MLRLAACLEEHYPHSIANAVVAAAREKDLNHEERHTTVEYVVAHGITSMIDDQKASIGSYHFIFEDEGVAIDEGDRDQFDALPSAYSLRYLALDGRLAAVLCIEDPLRDNAPSVIRDFRAAGFSNIVMMTGDSERTAAYIAKQAGVDHYIAEVLPEEKAAFVREQRLEGHKVIMIGDGVNDSPALSEADVGIADALMERIHRDYRVIIAFNSMLIALGAMRIITPQISAMMHNISTLMISMYNMTDVLEEKDEES